MAMLSELGLSVYCKGFEVGKEAIYTCAAAEAGSVYGKDVFAKNSEI